MILSKLSYSINRAKNYGGIYRKWISVLCDSKDDSYSCKRDDIQ